MICAHAEAVKSIKTVVGINKNKGSGKPGLLV